MMAMATVASYVQSVEPNGHLKRVLNVINGAREAETASPLSRWSLLDFRK
jgi:hypothetical protein